MFSALEKFLLTQAANAKKLDEMGLPAILGALAQKTGKGVGQAVGAVRKNPKLTASAGLGGLGLGYDLGQEDEQEPEITDEELEAYRRGL